MRAFELCDECRGEYENPLDRRFHAQPNACEACGPRLIFRQQSEKGEKCQQGKNTSDRYSLAGFAGFSRLAGSEQCTTASVHDAHLHIMKAVQALDNGNILAIKGVGGYHLACDATDDDAVRRLRERKHRDEKPFAVMVRDIEAAHKLCHISHDEERLLTSPQRPIVLLRKKDDATISDLVAPHNKNLGVMLPSTPLHYLLFKSDESHVARREPSPNDCASRVTRHASRPLVMTSGNITDEPIAYKDDDAISKLSGIADAFLTHDRDIHIRIDDSVARVIDEKPLVVRRARGYVPAPVRLGFDMPQILATGADMKNAICLTKGKNAFLSQYLGDMENLDANISLEHIADHLVNILDIKPTIIAHDMHPDYFSTRFAKERVTRHAPRVTQVQHHHAHIASCMAENDLPNEKVIGIALDGTGYGPDGTIWGGEILICNYEDFERVAHFAQVPLPGGDRAAKETWRMALSVASRESRVASNLMPLKAIDREKVNLILQMIEKDINCPKTSSCGRLFDAVAALIGLRMVNTFEG